MGRLKILKQQSLLRIMWLRLYVVKGLRQQHEQRVSVIGKWKEQHGLGVSGVDGDYR